MTLFRSLLALAFTLLSALAQAQNLAAIPPLVSHVTDTAGMLKPDQRAALDNVLKEYEARTGSQIAVLLVGSTAPEVIEQYGIRVADAWKLGRKGVDDGVILIVARDNPKALRRLRIEAGRGVQGTLTDAQSKRILQDVIAPYFRQNDYYGGLAAGVAAITSLLDKEQFPAPARQAGQQDESADGGLLPLFFVVLMIIGSIMSRTRRSRRGLSSNGWGRTAGIILGSGIGSSIGRHGGFGGGGFGGGSDGGFSGGGGGFDGGGASGDW
ncbi:MAG TPA: TPM domain-containing protein [Paucimonas sp.]|nr:TPM domain-containing protein [Paucimonas sp.]